MFDRRELKEDFLRTFRDECKAAAEKNQPILLLVFGHGDQHHYGVTIGRKGDEDSDPKLHWDEISAAIRGYDLSLTMLMTSCYSGGWLLKAPLNISAVTAADSREVSNSWQASIGTSYHGSMYATAVSRAFMSMEDEKATQIHPHPTGADLESSELASSSYAALSKTIYDILCNETNPLDGQNTIGFSAQDDKWEMEWRKRSGIPLAHFKARWDRLPRMTPQPQPSQRFNLFGRTGGSSSGSQSVSGSPALEGNEGYLGLHPIYTKSQALSIIRNLCRGYANSYPPRDNEAGNHQLHREVRLCLEDPEHEPTMRNFPRILSYRIDSDKIATEYKNILGLEYPDCHKVNVQAWQGDMRQLEGPYAHDKLETKLGRSSFIHGRLHDARVIDGPATWQGRGYSKPTHYLAIVFVENSLSKEEVEKAISTMLARKFL